MCFIGEIARFQEKNANVRIATKSTVLKVTFENLPIESHILSHSKNMTFVWVGMPDVREGQVKKQGQN